MRYIVIHDFDGLTRGEVLTDAAQIADIQASGHADHIVAIADDDATVSDVSRRNVGPVAQEDNT